MASWSVMLARAWYEDAWWLNLLRPVEWLYRGATALRRACYRRGVLATFRTQTPVVVVGNITVGGTGKTPIVIALVEALHRHGIRAGVVCRGYGASGANVPRIVEDISSAAYCGDEALLIHLRTRCPCVAAPSRVAAVRTLLRDFAVDIVICDDGLQHYALERDMEIVMYDAQRGFGNGRCLPAGPLREPPRRLAGADFVLARGSTSAPDGVRYRLDGLVNLSTGEWREASPRELGAAVYAVAGIGQPDTFFDSLAELGFTPQTLVFPDHHRYRARDFAALVGKPILMTEKDAVKCRTLVGENAWYLRVSAILPEAVIAALVSLVRP